MRYGKSQVRLINITLNDAAESKWSLSSHIITNYTETLRNLTRVITGARSEQCRDVQAIRRKENSYHLCNFIDFLNIHSLFKVPVNELINITTDVIASDDIDVDLAVDIRANIVSGLGDK